jgi:putative ABC transport system permease protein
VKGEQLRSLRVGLFLAYSSVARANPGVIVLTVSILALAGLNLLFVPGLLHGLVAGSDAKVKDTLAGHLVIESGTGSPLIANADSLVSAIKSIDGVTGAAARNTLGAELTFKNERTNCVVSGVVPEQEKSVFTISQSMTEGSFLSDDDSGMVLGLQVAGADQPDLELYSRSLKTVHVGDQVMVTYTNGVRKSYRVNGIFHTDFIQTDLQAFVTQREFEAVSPVAKGMAASVRVRVSDEALLGSISERIKATVAGLRVSPWQDYSGIMRSMTDSFNAINAILNVVNVLVAGITVFIVTYIDVTNRRRQIGIQRAIGITPSSIVAAYLVRAFFYAVMGVGVAVLLFVYVMVPLEAQYPFHFPFGPVYLVVGPSEVTKAAVILVTSALVAAFVPVWMSLRIRILDAIWG